MHSSKAIEGSHAQLHKPLRDHMHSSTSHGGITCTAPQAMEGSHAQLQKPWRDHMRSSTSQWWTTNVAHMLDQPQCTGIVLVTVLICEASVEFIGGQLGIEKYIGGK